MKRFSRFLILAAALLAIPFKAHAVDDVQETPVYIVGTPTCVAVSSSSWTVFPSTNPLTGRVGIKVNNRSTASAAVSGVLNALSIPGVSTNTVSIEIGVGENPFIPVAANLRLYLISNDATGPVTVCGQEVRQQN